MSSFSYVSALTQHGLKLNLTDYKGILLFCQLTFIIILKVCVVYLYSDTFCVYYV